MTSHPISGDYLRWLASQIRGDDDGNPNRTYEGLLAIMYEKEFVWLVPNDDNRVGDGLDLRVEFCRERNIHTDALNDLGPCSFLEVLIGLSRRLAFAAEGRNAPGWAWVLLHNLGLHRIADPVGRSNARKVNAILDKCIWRSYEPDGRGGFFPLARPLENQCQVELWYQMAAYINEMLEEG